MSVQVSYKKQITLFLVLGLVIISSLEIIIQVDDLLNPKCDFLKSDIFKNLNFLDKASICNEYNSIRYDSITPIRMLSPDQSGTFVNINNDGFRGKEILPSTQVDFRIIMIGGSTVFGYNTLSDNTTIPALIEQKISDEFPKTIEIINAGIPASDSNDEVYLLKNFLLKYEPDLIIMYDGWNDASQMNDIPHQEKSIFNDTKLDIFNSLLFLNYKTPNKISDLLNLEKNDLKNKQNSITSNDVNIVNEELKKNWNEICNYGKNNNFEVLLILQPILGTGDRILSNEEKSNLEKLSYDYQRRLDLVNQMNFVSNDFPSCMNFYDGRDLLDSFDNEHIFFDAGHMSDFGNEIVAEIIAKKLIPIIYKNI